MEVYAWIGYPPKFIRVLQKLHTDVKVHFEVNGVQKVINSTIESLKLTAQVQARILRKTHRVS